MRAFYVYELRDEAGRPFYVGKGSGRRRFCHVIRARNGHSSHTSNKIRSVWRRGGQVSAVVVFESIEEQAAFREEIRLIAFHGRATLTNQTDGGDGPSNPSAEVRAKIAASRLGRVATNHTRSKQRLAHIGKRHTMETRLQIAAKQRTIKKPWAVATARAHLGAGFAGHKWPEARRVAFRQQRLGHVVTLATRQKIAASKKGSIPWNKGRKAEGTGIAAVLMLLRGQA